MCVTPFSPLWPRLFAGLLLCLGHVLAYSATSEWRGLPKHPLTSVNTLGDTIWALAYDNSTPIGDETEGPNTFLYQSIDGGENWTLRPVGDVENPSNLRFVNANVGFLMAKDRLYRTGDGGETWVAKDFPGASLPVGFYESGEGHLYAMFNQGAFLSRNHGGSWEPFLVGYAPRSIFFVDSEVGYLSLGDGIYKTTNGGANYLPVLNELAPSIHFFDRDQGVAISSGFIYKTSDGGESWTTVNDEPGDHGLAWDVSSMEFLDGQNGLLSAKHIYRTTDGGETWEQVTFGEANRDIELSRVPETDSFVVVGSDSNVWELEGDGEVIDDYYLSPPLADTVFMDASRGWGVEEGIVFQTTDGGTVWRRVDVLNSEGREVADLVKIGNEALIVSGTAGEIWKLESGDEWLLLDSDLEGRLGNLDFVNPSDGWVLGGWGNGERTLYSTQDGGASWEERQLPEGLILPIVDFFDERVGWCWSFGQNELWNTNDGGEIWEMRESAWLADEASASLTGVAVLGHGSVLVESLVYDAETQQSNYERKASYDAGMTWVKVEGLTSSDGLKFKFLNPCYGYAYGDKLFSTEDGGRTWVEQTEVSQLLSGGNDMREIGLLDWEQLVASAGGRILHVDLEAQRRELVAFSEIEMERPYPVTLQFQSEVGGEYFIEKSSDLQFWERDCDRVMATSTQTQWVDADLGDPTEMPRFYRVMKLVSME